MQNDRKAALQRYLERYPSTGDRQVSAADGRPLPMHRGRTVSVMALAMLGLEWWVWTLLAPRFSPMAGGSPGSWLFSPAGVAFLLSILALTMIIAVAVRLFTDVDNRGIRLPDWAGGEFIPWTSVTRVSAGRSPEEIQVRAGERKITLNLMLFVDPAGVVALIRRHVPADRLENI